MDIIRDGLLRQETREERYAQIEQYRLSQPWRRRPSLPILFLIDDVSSQLAEGNQGQVWNKQWRDISEEWESRDPTTEVPIAKRIIDMFGDTADSLRKARYPTSTLGNLYHAGRVENILRLPLGLDYPDIGEEGVISKPILIEGRLVLAFEDGSTMEDGRAYEPNHPRSKKIVDGILSYYVQRGSDSRTNEDELDTLRMVASQHKVPRLSLQFWKGLINKPTDPQVVETALELKKRQQAEKDLRAREKKLEQSQSSSLDQTSHYVPRRGRGQRNVGR